MDPRFSLNTAVLCRCFPRLSAASLLLLLTVNLSAVDQDLAVPPPPIIIPIPGPDSKQAVWSETDLFSLPKVYPVEEPRFAADELVRPVYFDGVDYRGRPTRVFAWVGIPRGHNEKVPGIVLVHGAGGTAFRSWVLTWVARGYAAIAMDTCGSEPAPWLGAINSRTRIKDGGPAGWGEAIHVVNEPVKDQWTYHAVAAVVRAHSLLRSFPEVDADRIGLTGISWGGFLTNIVAGVDQRFRFAVPVYGCGFLGENSSWLEKDLDEVGTDAATRWLSLWDPSQYLGAASMPMLFCNGTNDPHYRTDSWQKTYRLVSSERSLSYKIRMPHGHPPAGDPVEIRVFADAILKGKPGLPRILDQGQRETTAWARVSAPVEITHANFVFTNDKGDWVARRWDEIAANFDPLTGFVTHKIPEGITAYYFNIHDLRGCIVSTEHSEI